MRSGRIFIVIGIVLFLGALAAGFYFLVGPGRQKPEPVLEVEEGTPPSAFAVGAHCQE